MRPPMVSLPPPYWIRYLVGLLVAVALISFALQSGCAGAGWRALDGTQKARDMFAQQLASVVKAKHADCEKQHGAKTPEYAACIKTHRKALDSWRYVARPIVNDSIAITAAGMQIADKAKSKANWIELIKPAVCAISRSVKAFGHWFPDKAAGVMSALKLAEGVTCK